VNFIRNNRLFLSFLLIGTTLFFSCERSKEIDKKFPEIKRLVAEKIEIESIFNPIFVNIKKDFLLFSAYHSPHMLYLYSLPDVTFLYSSGLQGNGPNEFETSFSMFCKSSSPDVYIWGYTPTRIKQFSITETGELLFKKNIDLSLHETFNQMHIVQDSLLIYSAIPSEFAIKKYNLNNNTVEGKIEIKKDNHPESMFYSNRGFVAANDSIIVYSYLYKDQIDLYRVNDLTLKERIIGEHTDAKIIIGDIENNIEYYISVLAGKKYFYALYNGAKATNENDYAIEVYDCNGTPIIKYLFDIPPFLFEVDEENGFIYGYNSNYEDYIIRYKIGG
jgi:hypothetical protein